MISLKFDVTIIVNAHKEYILLYKTLMSVSTAKRFAEKNGLLVEVIIVLDSPDDYMRDLVQNYSRNAELGVNRVIEISVGSLGVARNIGVENAQGSYLGFMDGDDLCSEGWIYKCYEACMANTNYIAHSEVCLFFEKDPHWWFHTDQREDGFDVKQLLVHNYWIALSFASKEIYEKVPYHPFNPGSGLGFEDWHWNCETVKYGYKHIAVKGTIHYIRKKEFVQSLNFQAAVSNCLIPSTEIMTNSVIWNDEKFESKKSLKRIETHFFHTFLLKLYRIARSFFWKPLHNALAGSRALEIIKKSASPATSLLKKSYGSDLPSWVLDETRKISEIEPLLFPNSGFLYKTRYSSYESKQQDSVELYQIAFCNILSQKIDDVLIIPWLKTGGADLGVLHHVEALIQSRKSVLVITTENTDSPWSIKLPAGTIFLEFGTKYFNLTSRDIAKTTLAKFLIHKKPSRIHIINSTLGWEMLEKYGKAINHNSKVYASLFCDSTITPEGERLGFKSYLPGTYKYLKHVFSDNSWYPKHLEQLYGIPKDLFKTLYFPVYDTLFKTGKDRLIKKAINRKRFKVFWAGRLDKQKRPDILLKICTSLPNIEFDIWGSSLLDKTEVIKEFKSLSNVKMRGSYSSFNTLPVEDYDLFLYTSQWDGLPNILLEVIATGIPIVSSVVGGISDIINEETAFPVYDIEDINKYCAHIEYVISNADEARERAQKAYSLLLSRHTWEKFCSNLLKQSEIM